MNKEKRSKAKMDFLDITKKNEAKTKMDFGENMGEKNKLKKKRRKLKWIFGKTRKKEK